MDIASIGKDRKKKLKGGPDLSTMVYGKVPPQARDLEEAVLGAIMLEKNAFDSASEVLKPECFYVDAHQRIFAAMIGLQSKSMPIDILTVVEELRKRDELDIVGGPYYVTKLTNTVVSSAHIETHCKILIQKFIQRELIRLSGEVISDSYEDSADAFGLLDVAESKLFELSNSFVKGNYEDIGNVLVQSVNRIEELRNKKDDISGVASGFRELDAITNGWQPTDLVIIAARPAVGKTAFALNLARNAAMHPTNPTPVGVFSLEMSNPQLVQRILSAQSDVHMEKISRGRLEDHEMEQLYSKGVKALSEAPIYLDDTPSLNVFELRAKCRRMVSRNKVGMIIIDYLQLMSGGGENKGMNREQEISGISRALKGLAKELKVPVLALSQLSRAVESRKEGNKIPQLSDLRESGAIEQDADMVIFIYRPEYYEINADEMGQSVKGETHIKIAKHRNGSLDTVKLKAMLHVQKFIDWDEDENNYGAGLPAASNFKPIGSQQGPQGGGQPAGGGGSDAALYIQKPSKMNEMTDFDDGFEEDNLF
jgi:replicative DNA helicase